MNANLISLDYRVPQCDTRLNKFPAVIGHAADADIRLDDHSVADHHCRIVSQGDHWIVSDLGTVHGTCVNHSRITEAILTPGDVLGVGMMSFLVEAVANRDEPALMGVKENVAPACPASPVVFDNPRVHSP